MGKDSGLMAIVAVLGLAYLFSRPRKENGVPSLVGPNGIDYPFPEEDLLGVPDETLHIEAIRTGKIIVHPTVVDVPTVPTPTEIERARIRVREIDKRIPTWVKAGWGKAQQAPGWMPEGEV